ncbi:MAG TPA: ATP-binding protein [Blastococcus sp.]|nr:ATP-binding protein [Blastococcus sp.]
MSVTGMKVRRQPAAALAGWVTLGAAAMTLAVLLLPFLRFAYRAPALHIVLETADALIALLVGYLVYGRFQQSRRLQEFLLVLALCTVAVANLVLTALPSAVTITSDDEFSRWAALAIRFLGTLLLTAAAVTPAQIPISRGRAVPLVLLVGGLVLTVGIAELVWGGQLPPTVDPAADLGDATRPRLVAHPLVLATQAVGAVLYGIAALAFIRRSDRRGDEFFRWVGAACILAAASRVHYLLFPSLYSEYVYTGDLLRLCFYLLLLVGAAREIRSYWELRTSTAVLEARRRMARDLHDGLAQELSFLWSQSRALSAGPPSNHAVERIGAAASRALDEARRAIAALTRPLDEPIARVLQQVADDLGSRYDVKVVSTADPDVEVSAAEGEALVRIASEAVRNAVRHGRARQIDLVLRGEPLCLSISDDGRGFTGQVTAPGGGFGMTSMRERAKALGAEFSVTSSPGNGTTVQVARR